MVLELLQNIALLIALAAGLRMLARLGGDLAAHRGLLAGLLFGAVGIAGMMTPLHFAPGIIYDGRSIVLSLAGLFGGPAPASVAALICGAYRAYLGGPGVYAGVGTIVESALLGTALFYLRRRSEVWVKPLPLWAFGLVVHVGMLALQLLIPGTGWEAIQRVGPAVLLLYPMGFLVIAHIFLDGERRFQAEHALRESEERFRAIFEESAVSMALVDAQGKFFSVNAASSRVLGYSEADFLDGDYLAITYPDDREGSAERFKQCLEDRQPYTILKRYITKDGRVKSGLTTISPVFGSDGQFQYAIAQVQDTTQQVEAKEALRKANKFLDATGQMARVGGWELDAETLEVTWSDETYRIHEIPIGRMPSLEEAIEFFHPDDREKLSQAIERALECGEPYDLELRFITAKGNELWTHTACRPEVVDGKTVRLVGTFQDITAQRLAEQALRQSEEKMKSIFRAAPVGIGVVVNRILMETNDQVSEMTGYSREELVGNSARMLYPSDEDYEYVGKEKYRQIREQGTGTVETRFQRKDGRIIDVLMSSTPMDPGDLSVGVTFTALDITARKRAQQEAERFKTISDTALHGNAVADLDGNLVYVNTYFARAHGYTPEEVVGQHISVFHNRGQMPAVRRVTEALLSDERFGPLEIWHQHRDGHEFPMLMTGTMLRGRDGEPEYLASSAIDITEQKQAERALSESEGKYRELVESATSVILRMDCDGVITFINDYGRELFGYSKEELVGQNVVGTIVPETETTGRDLRAMVEDIGRNPEKYIANENENTRRDGERLWVIWTNRGLRDDNGNLDEILCIGADATARKRAEEESFRQQRIITLNNRVVNVLLSAEPTQMYADVLDVILEALDCTYGFFGYLNDDGDLVCPSMTRDVWSKCRVPDKDIVFPRESWGGIWGRSLIEKRTVMANGGLRLPEGHVLLENALAAPLLDHGVLAGQFAVANKPGGFDDKDIALLESAAAQTAPVLSAMLEEARQRQARAQLEEQYRQAQKMESVGRLAGGMAHDFNNMLGVILGHAEMALEENGVPSSVEADLNEILSTAQRSADLIRQLLAFARRQTVSPRVLDMNETISGMLKMLRRLIGEDISLDWRPAPTVWPLWMDPSQLDQILANLCVNARDAIEGTGGIVIETKDVTLDEEYCASHVYARHGDFVQLTVSDTGHGMSADTLAHVFEPFFTTKGVGEGTGLGLATVYGIAKQNNGFVNVYSEEGKGTCFRIYLPRYTGCQGEVESPVDAEPERGQGETVLVVEDEPPLLHLSVSMLKSLGYAVLSANAPEAAIVLAHEHPGPIHLLMTDVVMPGMNGRQLAEKLLAQYPYMKLLFTSGYPASVIAHHGVLDKELHFLHKPFQKKELAAKVREALDTR